MSTKIFLSVSLIAKKFGINKKTKSWQSMSTYLKIPIRYQLFNFFAQITSIIALSIDRVCEHNSFCNLFVFQLLYSLVCVNKTFFANIMQSSTPAILTLNLFYHNFSTKNVTNEFVFFVCLLCL